MSTALGGQGAGGSISETAWTLFRKTWPQTTLNRWKGNMKATVVPPQTQAATLHAVAINYDLDLKPYEKCPAGGGPLHESVSEIACTLFRKTLQSCECHKRSRIGGPTNRHLEMPCRPPKFPRQAHSKRTRQCNHSRIQCSKFGKSDVQTG
jgi:hypothetical protein